MKKRIIGWTLAILAAITLIGAPSAAFADEPEPIVITSIPAPEQIDNCGPETKAWYSASYWDFGQKVYGLSRYFQKSSLDGTFTVRYTAKPGYVIADGVQTEWRFPAFSDVPCAATATQLQKLDSN